MKKALFILLLLGFVSSSGVFAQKVPTYRIPSYNQPVCGLANFIPSFSGDPASSNGEKEKRSQNIAVHGTSGSYAIVWIYSLDGLDILGPYTVYAGDTLSVGIDDREWGVTIWSAFNIDVDVWVSGGAKTPGK